MIFQILQEQVDLESRAVVEVEVLVQLYVGFTESIDASIDHCEVFADLTLFGYAVDGNLHRNRKEERQTADDFDLFNVIKRTIVLNAVTNSVAVEVLGCANSTNNGRVSVSSP